MRLLLEAASNRNRGTFPDPRFRHVRVFEGADPMLCKVWGDFTGGVRARTGPFVASPVVTAISEFWSANRVSVSSCA